jgi:hypothetical protein
MWHAVETSANLSILTYVFVTHQALRAVLVPRSSYIHRQNECILVEQDFSEMFAPVHRLQCAIY